jgi:FlaA1/EpsC-like NDP-sugar epimerase
MLLSKAIEACPTAAGSTASAASRVAGGRWARWITAGHPHLAMTLATLALSAGAWFLSFLLRFEFTIPNPWTGAAAQALPIVLLVQGACFYVHGVFRIMWPYVGIRDALVILRATIYATAILFAINALTPGQGLAPKGVILFNGFVSYTVVCGLYLLMRFAREARLRAKPAAETSKSVFIIGAGDSGDALLREIERVPDHAMRVEGFIDDAAGKRGAHLRGVPVIGTTADLQRLVTERNVRSVLVALPSAGGARLREIVRPLLKAGVEVKVLPGLNRLSTSSDLLPQLKEVAIEDLLRRDPVRMDKAAVGEFLGGKTVLVTGAAGSIGSELCRQILRYGPSKLIALDWAETPLHDLMLELRPAAGKAIVPELGDVTDFVRVRAVFAQHAPDVVFHAAALKHVPVCEDHPREAIRVNVGGTQTVARAASNSGTGLFVLISTDKAVNPSSVMGSTKRAAELIIQGLQREGGPTRYAAVRFGNVLGSNGSVLRIFKNQLTKGGPLTVTHPDMRRFFMTIPEAVELVLQAAIQGAGGEVFELDMGQPVKIVDLAEDFIRLSGFTPGRDIQIEFTGMRPGEKLFEELYLHSETVEPTSHPKVFLLKKPDGRQLDPAVKLCLERLGPLDPELDPDLSRLNRAFRRMVDDATERVRTP